MSITLDRLNACLSMLDIIINENDLFDESQMSFLKDDCQRLVRWRDQAHNQVTKTIDLVRLNERILELESRLEDVEREDNN